jgi:outer membrane protein
MNWKRILQYSIIAAASFGQSALAQAPPKLTLAQAQATALSNHPRIQSAQYSALAANEATRTISASYYPQAYGSMTAVGAEHNTSISAGGLTNSNVLDRYADGLAVGQLITDFGRTQNLVASSRLESQAANENVQATRQAVLLAVDRAYYDVLAAQAVRRVAEKTVEDRQLVSDEVTTLANSKLRSTLDVSFANVNLAQAKLASLQAQNDVQAAFAALSVAMGFQEQRVFELEEAPLPPPPPPDPKPLIDQALHQRPELAGESFNVQSLEKFATAERDLWFPTVSALGAAGLVPYRVAGLASRYAAGGANISIPIFNGRLFRARHAEAEMKVRQENQLLRDLQDSVAHDVEVAWLNATTAYQRLGITQLLLDQASRSLDLAQERYKLGLGSIVELSQAELNQTQAEVEQTRAKYDYQAQIAVLNFETGALP